MNILNSDVISLKRPQRGPLKIEEILILSTFGFLLIFSDVENSVLSENLVVNGLT